MSTEKDRLRQRLEAMNRRPLKAKPWPQDEPLAPELERLRQQVLKQRPRAVSPLPKPKPPPAPAPETPPLVYSRKIPTVGHHRGGERALDDDDPVLLEDVLDGADRFDGAGGTAYELVTRVRDLPGDNWEQLFERYCLSVEVADSPFGRRLRRKRRGKRPPPDELLPEHLLFMDIETTGLGNSPLFLIGDMAWEDDGLVVRQYFARHYGEEAAVVRLFLERMAERQLLVTFNGKSFDVPFIRTRAQFHRLAGDELDVDHFDLLHESRRAWKGEVPNCRLQTLEQWICGRQRAGDIPGSEIPEAYHRYVRSGNAAQMVDVIKHNLLDLVTLAELITKLPPPG